MREVGIIVGMMVLTFGPRYLPFALAGQFKLPDIAKKALDFVPIATLCAIVSQVTLIHDGELQLSLSNSYLVAAITAFIVAITTKKMFLTIVVGLISYALCLWVLH
jgi:branched-subunit amino acid transport protein